MAGILLTIFTVWLGGHAYIAWRLGSPFADRSGLWPWFVVAVVLAAASFAAIALNRGRPGEGLHTQIRWMGYTYFGFFSILLSFTLLRDAALLLVSLLDSFREAPDESKRATLTQFSSIAALAASGGITAASIPGGNRIAPVKRVEIPVSGLHPNLDGYRIVQITDIHVGAPTTVSQLRAIVDRVNDLEPDLLAFTGDLVDGKVEILSEDVAPLDDLRARDGKFFCTGNHEYYSNSKAWEAEVARRGLTVLNNEHRVLRIGNANLIVGGVTDFDAARFIPEDASDPHKAIEGAPEGFKLLLAHQPKSQPGAKAAGWDLQLSGHTHGGQYWPFSLIIDWFHPVSSGLTKMDDFHVYVSRGTALWGPPLRSGAPNEITEVVLRAV